jgi:hypothetical protein
LRPFDGTPPGRRGPDASGADECEHQGDSSHPGHRSIMGTSSVFIQRSPWTPSSPAPSAPPTPPEARPASRVRGKGVGMEPGQAPCSSRGPRSCRQRPDACPGADRNGHWRCLDPPTLLSFRSRPPWSEALVHGGGARRLPRGQTGTDAPFRVPEVPHPRPGPGAWATSGRTKRAEWRFHSAPSPAQGPVRR